MVTQAVARAGVAITSSADSKDPEEDVDGSPLRTQQSMTSLTMTGVVMAGINTPSVAPSAMLNTKPIGTQLFSLMAPPQE